MDVIKDWPLIRKLFRDSFASNLQYAIASVSEDGSPHLTPIGSLMLTEPGKAVYFEKFTSQLPKNLKRNGKVTVMAVNSSKWFWLTSLIAGRFSQVPAIRLKGTAGDRRPATKEEAARFQRRVNVLRFTKGHKLLWRDMSDVRELYFDRAEPVKIGRMSM